MPASNSKVAAIRAQKPRGIAANDFVLADEIPMDRGHTLDQVTSRFRGVKDGLPELIKNAKDQYSRHGILEREQRQIVVIVDTTNHRLGVLDFAGARSSDFEGWTTWSSRTAGRSELAEDIEAGHGNGGKSFMVRGATEFAFIESCFEGRRTRMGFNNERPTDRYKPGYGREAGVLLNNISEPNTKARLEGFLAELGISSGKLPNRALAAFQKRNAFTGVLLCSVVDWEGRRKNKVKRLAEAIPGIISSHGQTALSIETCEVWVIINGTLVTASPISPTALEPYPGFEEPRYYDIPEILSDPETGDSVDMVCGTVGPRYLHLFTSTKQMQLSDDTKARNVIRVWNNRNNVATWPLHSLGVLVTSISFIFGEIRCPALIGDHLSGADRIHLSDTPLVRALKEWTRQRVKELADDLHRAMMSENKPRDREQAKSALESFRDLMRQFLDPDVSGEIDEDNQPSGEIGKNGKGRKKRRHSGPFGERIDQIILEAGSTSITLAYGTTVPLVFRCIEYQPDGSTKPVKSKGLLLHSTVPGIMSFDDSNRIIAASVGQTDIWLSTPDGRVISNKISCNVTVTTDVNIVVPEEVLLQGQRVKLTITFQTNNGPRDDLLIEGTIDEPGMGLLGRHGRFTAGFKQGQATIRVRFGPNPESQRVALVQIGDVRIPAKGEGTHGSDIPEILLCGDTVPGMEEFPEEQRTLPGGEEFPTIIEDPLFPNVVWINPTSKEAMRVRRMRGGSSGVASISSKTFMHFVALKCFDVLKRLHVRQALRGQTVTEFQFIQLAAFAEMECAGFIDAAWEISDQLVSRSEASIGQQSD